MRLHVSPAIASPAMANRQKSMDPLDCVAARYALAASRGFITSSGQLSAVGAALLAPTNVQETGGADDVHALERALDGERQMAEHYQQLIDSSALEASTRTLVVLFRQHHAAHYEALTTLLAQSGANGPLLQTYTVKSLLNDELAHQRNVLACLAQIEQLCSDHNLERTAGCHDMRNRRALMRLSAQCAARAGALTQAAGKVPEMRARSLIN